MYTWVKLVGPILLCDRKQRGDSSSKRHLFFVGKSKAGPAAGLWVSQRSAIGNIPGASSGKDLLKDR